MVMACRPANAPPDWKLPTVPEMKPKAEERFLHSSVLKRREMAQPMLTKTFLQPAKIAIICTACHEYAHTPPPISPFLLVQNWNGLSTDNMQSNLYDKYTRHWFKRLTYPCTPVYRKRSDLLKIPAVGTQLKPPIHSIDHCYTLESRSLQNTRPPDHPLQLYRQSNAHHLQ